MPVPSVGRMVHYVSHGTPGGEYLPQCRAAIITAADPVEVDPGQAVLVEDRYDVSVCVLNPTGLFFKEHLPYQQWDAGEAGPGAVPPGGTWHWPERTN